jgi:hypothetical protein
MYEYDYKLIRFHGDCSSLLILETS